MKSLLPFLRLFKFAKIPLFLGVVLMILGLVSSLGLLTVSGWFLAATAIAGIGALFNFFYPSASVRGLAIGRTVIRYVEKIVTHDATFRLLAKIRVNVFKTLIPLSPATLNRYRQSDLLNRLVADVDTLDNLYLRLIAPFITATFTIGLLTLVLSSFEPHLSLLIGGTLFFLLCTIPTLFYHLGKKLGQPLTLARANYRSQFVAFVEAQAELLLFNAVDEQRKKMANTETHWQGLQQKEANLAGLSTSLVIFANGILLSAVLWISANAQFAQHLAPENQFYQGAIIALFAFATLASFEILIPLGGAFLHIGQVISSAERLEELSQVTPEVAFLGKKTLSTIEKGSELINFNEVSFRYPNRSDWALNKVSLKIFSHQKVAILGKTGSGKSSLLQLFVRHYDPNSGEILFNGSKLSDYSEKALRDSTCLLTQRMHIFSDTLRNNLQLANLNEVTDEKMLFALATVGLTHLTQTEEGLDLWLGEGGRTLSGGEQRRIGLARVLLNQAPMILLDEPTEGLDRDTERQVLKALFKHSENKTLLMVTHRLTHIEQFDQIILVDNGEILDSGTFEELKFRSAYFQSLLQRL